MAGGSCEIHKQTQVFHSRRVDLIKVQDGQRILLVSFQGIGETIKKIFDEQGKVDCSNPEVFHHHRSHQWGEEGRTSLREMRRENE